MLIHCSKLIVRMIDLMKMPEAPVPQGTAGTASSPKSPLQYGSCSCLIRLLPIRQREALSVLQMIQALKSYLTHPATLGDRNGIPGDAIPIGTSSFNCKFFLQVSDLWLWLYPIDDSIYSLYLPYARARIQHVSSSALVSNC